MSRSYKKPIIKDKNNPKIYKRIIRRVQKYSLAKIHKNTDITYMEVDCSLIDILDNIEINIPHHKTIVNDYNFCDYIFRNCGIKNSRK